MISSFNNCNNDNNIDYMNAYLYLFVFNEK